MRPKLFTLALVPLALVCGTAFAQEQTAERGKLRWNLQAGDELYYAFSWKLQQKQGVTGQMDLQDATINVHYTTTQKVSAVGEDGLAAIDATITSVKASVELKMMGMPTPPMGYDSTNPDAGSPMLRVIRHVVGKSFSFKLAPTGAVSDVSGGEAIREAVSQAAQEELAQGMGGGMGGPGGGMGMGGPQMGKMVAGQLTIAFADGTLQTTLDVVNNVLPESGNAAPDTSWTRDVVEKLPEIGSVSFTGKYTHAGSANGNTRIIIRPEGEMTLEREKVPADPSNPMAQMQRELLKGMQVTSTSLEGTATFGAGRIVDSEVIQEIKSEGELPPMLKMQMGQQDADMKLDMTNKLTLRYEKQDAPVELPAPEAEEPQKEEEPKKEGASF